jgi:hypothetical protein
VPAPRSVHARLLINGEYSGLYGLTEEIDNRFTDYSFKEGAGNIYKEVWPTKPNGEAQIASAYISALKTNEEKPNYSFINEFGETIANSNTSEMKSVIKKYMDINKIISYCVVDRIIRHDDGPFHWYCSSNTASCYNHNYFWFEDQKNKKMHIIPWDMDGIFEHVIRNSNPVTPILDNWGEKSGNCEPIGSGFKQRSAGCDKLTAAWVSFDEEFKTIKSNFQQNILSDAKTINQIDIWAKQIEPLIIEADNFHNIGNQTLKATNIGTWQNAINTLKEQVKAARLK